MSGWVWLRRAEELIRLRANWQQLWLETPEATPFQSPGWLLNYLESFPPDDLLAALRFDGSRLVGLLVGQITNLPGSQRTYRFLAEDRSDYLGPLLAPDRLPEISVELVSHLESLARFGIRVELAQIPPESPVLGPLRKRWQKQPSVICPQVDLPSSYADLTDRLSPKFRAKVAYAARRVRRTGELSLQLATDSNYDDYLDILFQLHSDRWQHRGQGGVLPAGKVQAFFRATCNALRATGTLALFILRLDASPLAAICGFQSGRRFYYYIGAFNPEFHRLSPGTVMLDEVLRHVTAAGFSQFDFLRGCEPYKYRWGAINRETYQLVYE